MGAFAGREVSRSQGKACSICLIQAGRELVTWGHRLFARQGRLQPVQEARALFHDGEVCGEFVKNVVEAQSRRAVTFYR